MFRPLWSGLWTHLYYHTILKYHHLFALGLFRLDTIPAPPHHLNLNMLGIVICHYCSSVQQIIIINITWWRSFDSMGGRLVGDGCTIYGLLKHPAKMIVMIAGK